MKKYYSLFGIVLLVGSLVLALSSCNESMTDQMDRVIDTEPEPPPQGPVTPTVEESVTSPIAPLPGGTVVFVAPRPLTSRAAGQQLQVRIDIKGATGVIAYGVTVRFDPTALRYVASANADYLPAGAFVAPAQVTATSVYLNAVSLSGVANAAAGTLATVTFEIVSAKASTLALNSVVLSDANVQELPFTAVDGQINAP